jgi:hypothetical protein
MEELLDKIKEKILSRECSFEYLMQEFNLTDTEIMGYIRILRFRGENINITRRSDGTYIEDFGDKVINNHNTKTIINDEEEYKILLISDTRICSKFEQISILNNIYQIAHEMGIKTVLHLGDLTEGIYFGKKSQYNQTVLHHNPDTQAMYVKNNYPYIKGMTTYFITGEHDLSFLKTKSKEDVGKAIGNLREDLVYLGQRNCMIYLQDSDGHKPILIDMRHPEGKIPYTISYKPQKVVDSMRSEERPDILNIGHFLVQDTFMHHDVLVNQVPSVTATTPEMVDNSNVNVVGATILTLSIDKSKNKSRLAHVQKMFINYREALEDDYRKFKILHEEEKVLRKGTK